eukprot:m.796 g.796  ORF g.796 m.796 type:complete len:819 (-) comp744_c0_seq1:188-2644(-)
MDTSTIAEIRAMWQARCDSAERHESMTTWNDSGLDDSSTSLPASPQSEKTSLRVGHRDKEGLQSQRHEEPTWQARQNLQELDAELCNPPSRCNSRDGMSPPCTDDEKREKRVVFCSAENSSVEPPEFEAPKVREPIFATAANHSEIVPCKLTQTNDLQAESQGQEQDPSHDKDHNERKTKQHVPLQKEMTTTFNKHYPNGDEFQGYWVGEEHRVFGTRRCANGDWLYGEWRDDCLHGDYGIAEYAKGDRYEGAWCMGLYQGDGTLCTADGDRYEGTWHQGQKHGFGILSTADEDRYEGPWKNDQRHGSGTQQFADGSCFKGTWNRDAIHGDGTLVGADGDNFDTCEMVWDSGDLLKYTSRMFDGTPVDIYATTADGALLYSRTPGRFQRRYHGDIRYRRFHGKGILQFANGNVYNGEWKDDEMDGQGTMQYANGDCYHGSWRNGGRSGFGTMTYANGDQYKGEFFNDCVHGTGDMTCIDGSHYSGQWHFGFRHGQGKQCYPNVASDEGAIAGSISSSRSYYEGSWWHGHKQGLGVEQIDASHRYEGRWHNGLRCGSGHCAFANGNIYEGQWKNGYMHGYGTLHKFIQPKTFDVYEGQFKHDKPHKRCIIRYHNGNVFIGSCFEGLPHGLGKLFVANTAQEWHVEWVHGDAQFQSAVSVQLRDGTRYYGHFQDFTISGLGEVMYTNQDRFEGMFSNKTETGFGVLHLASGDRLEGHWENGHIHGSVKMYDAPGEHYKHQYWHEGTVLSEGDWLPIKPRANASDSTRCAICLGTESVDYAIVPCGHRVLCEECHSIFSEQENSRCPMCRSHMQTTLRVFP